MKILEGMSPGKWKKFIANALCSFLAIAMMGAHPFYLSVTDIEYFPEEELLGVTINVYTDDLEAVLEELGAESLRLGTAEEHEDADRYIAKYLDRVVRWQLEGEPVTFIWLGKEVEPNNTYLYLEAGNISDLPSITVENRLFLDQLETQENIVHLHCGEGPVSERLNLRNPSGELTCEGK